MPKLSQLKRLAGILLQPGGLHAFLTWKPFSLTAFTMLRALKQQGLSPQTILDGGANVGQFARAAAGTYPDAQILSFEALPDIADTLRQNLADCPRVQVVAAALGRHDGALTFYRNAYTLASSALSLRTERQADFPKLEQHAPIEVPVGRLDTLVAEHALSPPVLLKLDLQGYELEALKGASQTLQRVQYVLLEVAFEPTYEGEPLFEDLYAFMREAGFRFLRPIDCLRDASNTIAQMDALFTRIDPPQD